MVVSGFEKGRHVQDSGVVDEDIQPPEVFQGRLDNGISAVWGHNAVSICHRLASRSHNFGGDITGGREGSPQTLHAAAEIVHDDFCSTTPQFEGVGATETSSGSGYDCYSAFECEAHGLLLERRTKDGPRMRAATRG
jgi:hypothetical protein